MNPNAPAVIFVLDLIVNPLDVKEVAERQSARFVREMPNQPHTGGGSLRRKEV
jgi:hypothetical protein